MLLKNNRIILRAPEPEDLETIYRWENNTQLWYAGENYSPLSRFVLKKYLEQAHLDIYQTLQLRLMITKTNMPSVPIGSVDFFEFDPFTQKAGIGILIEEDERRKGYARDALLLAIGYAKNALGLKQVYCYIATDNFPSIQLFQDIGFDINGTKKAWFRKGSNWIDVHFLQLLLT